MIFIKTNYSGFYADRSAGIEGNLGLLDQVHAMKWIQKNIRYFNGDPNKITLHGHSAGAGDVGLHLVSNLTKGKTSSLRDLRPLYESVSVTAYFLFIVFFYLKLLYSSFCSVSLDLLFLQPGFVFNIRKENKKNYTDDIKIQSLLHSHYNNKELLLKRKHSITYNHSTY